MRTIPDSTPGFVSSDAVEVAPGVAYLRNAIANVVFLGDPGAGDRGWLLIDTGTPGKTGAIVKAAARRFGDGARPAAIVLTHGHFDHVGGLPDLADRWSAPVLAHPLELPYLTGRSSYPPADPTVGGGAMSWSSPLYPRGPFEFSRWAQSLMSGGALPVLPDWRWIHTPGHSPGHVSLWRERDAVLVTGDAFVTTRQESARGALGQTLELNGPPMYFTPDWPSAAASVRTLAGLRPAVAVTGHGRAIAGEDVADALVALAREFEAFEVPSRGRYVGRPARFDEAGVVWEPDGSAALSLPVVAGAAVLLAGLSLFAAAAGRG